MHPLDLVKSWYQRGVSGLITQEEDHSRRRTGPRAQKVMDEDKVEATPG